MNARRRDRPKSCRRALMQTKTRRAPPTRRFYAPMTHHYRALKTRFPVLRKYLGRAPQLYGQGSPRTLAPFPAVHPKSFPREQLLSLACHVNQRFHESIDFSTFANQTEEQLFVMLFVPVMFGTGRCSSVTSLVFRRVFRAGRVITVGNSYANGEQAVRFATKMQSRFANNTPNLPRR